MNQTILSELCKLDKQTILNIAHVANVRHQILFLREAYKEAGMPEHLLNYFDCEWTCEDELVRGIYGFNVLKHICEAFRLDYKPLFGRNLEACEMFVTIERFCK